MKKGQHQQVFIYILALFIISLTLVMGLKYVNNLRDRQNEAETVLFYDEIRGVINSVSHTHEKIVNKRFDLPGNYDWICFVDLDTVRSDILSFTDSEFFLIADSVNAGENNNIFLIGEDFSGFRVEKVAVNVDVGDEICKIGVDDSTACICIQAQRGSVDLHLIGTGRKTIISENV